MHDLAAPERRQPAQLDREQIDQPDPNQEGRQAHAHQRQRHHGIRQQAAAIDRRVDPERDPQCQRQQRRQHRELYGCRQPFGDQIGDRATLPVRHAEVAVRYAEHEAPELDRHRIVEAEPLGELAAFGDGCFLAHHAGDRVADEPEHRKRNERHCQHHHDGLGEAAQEICDHADLTAIGGPPASDLRVPIRTCGT